MQRYEFTAMGTRVECFSEAEGVTARIGFGTVEREFARLEQLLSRFLPDSELSRLNRDRVIEAGAELLELVVRSLDARQETGGRFDPTVLNALVAAGYDRTFELVGSDCAGDDRAPCVRVVDGSASIELLAESSYTVTLDSISVASQRGGRSTGPVACWQSTVHASSTRAAISPPVGWREMARGL